MAKIEKLNDDSLNEVSGGVIFDSSVLNTDDHKNLQTPWEVLGLDGNIMVDKNGKELRFATKNEAIEAARSNNISEAEVSWEWVKGRRGIF
jgi:hypothetical protein